MKNTVQAIFVAVLVGFAVACVGLASGCGLKPIARTVKDIAFGLCELTGTEQAKDGEIDGMSVADWCNQAKVIKPFMDDVLASKMAGAARVPRAPTTATEAGDAGAD